MVQAGVVGAKGKGKKGAAKNNYNVLDNTS